MKKNEDLSAINQINSLASMTGETLIYNAALLAAELKNIAKNEKEMSCFPQSFKAFERLAIEHNKLERAIEHLDKALGNLRNATNTHGKD